jgi:hypothetical protein
MEFLYGPTRRPLDFICDEWHLAKRELTLHCGFPHPDRFTRTAPLSALIAWSIAMLDFVMPAIALISFALSIAYVYACDQL